jgi:hypothetical protein
VAGVAVLVAVLVALSVLAGCGGDGVAVDRFKVSVDGQTQCRALLNSLPSRVADEGRRTVTKSAYAAAWGDPAIVLRCGVGRPKGFTKFSQCQRANGIDWFVPDSVIDDLSADAVMTTVGRTPAIEVRLPAHYRPAGSAAVMVDLAPVLKAHTRETTPCT